MFDDLFQKKPEYDENGQLVGYSQPKIVWVILALVVLYFCKNKIMKQTGGGRAQVWREPAVTGLFGLIFVSILYGSYEYLYKPIHSYNISSGKGGIADVRAILFFVLLLGIVMGSGGYIALASFLKDFAVWD